MGSDLDEIRIKEEEDLAKKVAQLLNLPYYDLKIFKPQITALKYIPLAIAQKAKIIPLRKTTDTLLIGVVDPYNENFLAFKENLEKKGIKISMAIISHHSFEIGLKEYEYIKERKITYVRSFEINAEVLESVEKEINRREDLEKIINELIDKNPFFILDYLLAGALKFNASDIHFEPKERDVLVRYRLDGLLYDVFSFSKNIYQIIKNRIKVLSGIMIDIKNMPQDGRFSIILNNDSVDFRVSILPTFNDEAIVLRILVSSQIKKTLEELGFRDEDLETLNIAINSPNGLILNTGPTGSGKTTTLYAIILKIKKPELKIMTIENPVEYRIEGISQSQTDEKRGFTFDVALRSFLRQDPDVILVGEIRDKETAQTAIQASLTGHLVLSTLHTNDSLGAIPRFISLGVDPKLIPSALRLIIAQRLVRKICPYCKEEYVPEEKLKEKIIFHLQGLPTKIKEKIDFQNIALVKSKGCDKCFGTGYKGRLGIFELLKVDKRLEDLIYKNPSELEIYNAVKDDFVSLKQDALIKVLNKITTVDEIERVVGLI